MNWWVYIIKCCDGSLYTGISTDLDRRFQQHRSGKGAKYFRIRQPLEIVYSEGTYSRHEASRREVKIKKMSHREKQVLIGSGFASRTIG